MKIFGILLLTTFSTLKQCTVGIKAANNVATFFLYHDSSTTYEREGIKFQAKVNCSKGSNLCNVTVQEGRQVTTLYEGLDGLTIRFKNGCPPVVCGKNCSDLTVNPSDKCPVCECANTFTREPCRCEADCPKNVSCTDNVCSYAKNVNNTLNSSTTEFKPNWFEFCQFQSDCGAFHKCVNGECRPATGAKVSYHLAGTYCNNRPSVECPDKKHYKCKDNACWAKDGFCTGPLMCRQGEGCVLKENKCVKLNNDVTVSTQQKKKPCKCKFWQTCQPDGTCVNPIKKFINKVASKIANATSIK